MKTLRITLLTTVAALFATLFAGCAGPAGTDGAVGPTGPTGVNGSSVTFTIDQSFWQSSTAGGYNYLIAGYTSVSILTSDAISNGVVAAYFQASSGNWVPMPDTYPTTTTSGVSQTMTYSYNVGTITFQVQNSDNSVPDAPVSFTVQVVTIPASVLKQHPGINVKDYNEVMQAVKSNL